MPYRQAVATTAAMQAVEIVEYPARTEVVSHGPRKIEIEGEYARFYPQWEKSDLQKMPASVLVPISAIPRIIEQMLAVLGHRPIWPEKH